MSCQTCDIEMPSASNYEIMTVPLYCTECIGVACTMAYMPFLVGEEATTSSENGEYGAKKKTPSLSNCGMTIEKMLMKIWSHPLYNALPASIHRDLSRIGRFDRRRNAQDNNYVRIVWHDLTNGVNKI